MAVYNFCDDMLNNLDMDLLIDESISVIGKTLTE